MNKIILLISFALMCAVMSGNAQSCRKKQLKYDCTVIVAASLHTDTIQRAPQDGYEAVINSLGGHLGFPTSAPPTIAGEILKKVDKLILLDFETMGHNSSWNVGNVHFVSTGCFANDAQACQNAIDWLAKDLKENASKGVPVVYIQNDTVPSTVNNEWEASYRARLFDVLDKYNLAAFFVGQSQVSALETYRGHTIYRLGDVRYRRNKPGSFAVLRIKDNALSIVTCKVLGYKGYFALIDPSISTNLSDKKSSK